MKRTGLLAVMLAATMSFACNTNNDTDATARNADNDATVGTAGDVDRNEPSAGDKDFVNDQAIAGMAEVKLGMLATEKSTNAQVKQFGQMMITDHTKAGDALKAAAMQHNLAVPTAIDEKHQDLYDRLSKLQGAEFDREYVNAMVDGHQDVADQLESRVDKVRLGEWKTEMKDWLEGKSKTAEGQIAAVTPEHSDNLATMAINQWASDTYPKVQQHLIAAKALKDGFDKTR
jgi:putative membrane protein